MSQHSWYVRPRGWTDRKNALLERGMKDSYDLTKVKDQNELEQWATILLEEERRKDGRQYVPEATKYPWLTDDQMKARRQKEILPTKPDYSGVIDPSTTVNGNGQPGMFWRQDPEGRKPVPGFRKDEKLPYFYR